MRGDVRRQGPIRRLRVVVVIPAMTVLASCGGMMQQAEMPPPMTMATVEPPPPVAPAPLPATPPPAAPMVMAPMPTPGIAARERFQLAINSLQQGDSEKAAVELRAYLAEVPNSTPARNLLNQIETPLEMLYPAESFNVQLQQSETLSSLAGIYLGDVLQFYGLARYNMIQNPGRVSLGQTIRIPSTPATLAAQANRASMMSMQASATMPAPMPAAPPPAAAPAPAAPPPVVASVQPPAPPARPAPPRDPWISIRENVAAGRFDAAIMDAEAAQVRPNAAQAVVLASAYAGNAKAVQATNAMEAAAQAFRAGQLYLETANRPQDALAPLELAVMLAPMDNRAQMLLATAKTRVSDGYYRDGVAAFQRQDLDGAIAAWDKALAVDPNHRNAQLNRAQAIELKQNLQRLK
jgi:tetratricopeptide (TPR) repeat protein